MPQQSDKGHVEQIRASLVYNDRTFEFLLPSADDHISKTINSGSFYEPELLEFLKAFLTEDDLVLDVGANIGNHTVFFAGVCGCQVEAFEPNAEASRYLGRNIELNALTSRVNVHNVALSDTEGRVSIDVSVPGNLGATSYKADELGVVTATTADSLSFGKKVRLIKIDAEGMDALVVKGAKHLIKDNRPIIVAEAVDSAALDQIAVELAAGEYVAVGCFNATDTYVFAPNKTASDRVLIARMEASGLLGVQQGLKALKKVVSANKLTLDKVAYLQRQLSEAVFGGVTPLKDAGPIQERIQKLSIEAVQANNELTTLREKLEQQQSDMFELLKQFGAVAFSAGDTGARLSHFSTDLSQVETRLQGYSVETEHLKSQLDVIAEKVELGLKANAQSAEQLTAAERKIELGLAASAEIEHLKSQLDIIAAKVELGLKSNAESAEQLAAAERKMELGFAENREVTEVYSVSLSQVLEAISEIEKQLAKGF